MRRGDVARLALLGAIWGGSFLFIRIVSPAIGPVLTARWRTACRGCRLPGRRVVLRLHRRLSEALGAGCAGERAGALTVTYLTPLFGMVWGALFLGETLTVSMLAGAALVILGTVFVLRN